MRGSNPSSLLVRCAWEEATSEQSELSVCVIKYRCCDEV
jgi:hypothetical protein